MRTVRIEENLETATDRVYCLFQKVFFRKKLIVDRKLGASCADSLKEALHSFENTLFESLLLMEE